MKKLFIWLFAGQLICALITALICYFFDYWVIRKAVDIAFFVGAGVVFLGFSAAQNASTEDFEIYLSTRYIVMSIIFWYKACRRRQYNEYGETA